MCVESRTRNEFRVDLEKACRCSGRNEELNVVTRTRNECSR
jgi:hypothetical protein